MKFKKGNLIQNKSNKRVYRVCYGDYTIDLDFDTVDYGWYLEPIHFEKLYYTDSMPFNENEYSLLPSDFLDNNIVEYGNIVPYKSSQQFYRKQRLKPQNGPKGIRG